MPARGEGHKEAAGDSQGARILSRYKSHYW